MFAKGLVLASLLAGVLAAATGNAKPRFPEAGKYSLWQPHGLFRTLRISHRGRDLLRVTEYTQRDAGVDEFNFIPVSGNVYRIEAVDPVDASRGLDARIRPVEASSITKGGLIVAQTGGSGTLFRLLSGQELASQGSEGMRCYEITVDGTDFGWTTNDADAPNWKAKERILLNRRGPDDGGRMFCLGERSPVTTSTTTPPEQAEDDKAAAPLQSSNVKTAKTVGSGPAPTPIVNGSQDILPPTGLHELWAGSMSFAALNGTIRSESNSWGAALGPQGPRVFKILPQASGLYGIQWMESRNSDAKAWPAYVDVLRAGQPVRVKPSGSGTPFKLQRLYSTDNLRKTMSCFRITLPGTDLAFTSVATNNGSKHIVKLGHATDAPEEQEFCFGDEQPVRQVKVTTTSKTLAPTKTRARKPMRTFAD